MTFLSRCCAASDGEDDGVACESSLVGDGEGEMQGDGEDKDKAVQFAAATWEPVEGEGDTAPVKAVSASCLPWPESTGEVDKARELLTLAAGRDA